MRTKQSNANTALEFVPVGRQVECWRPSLTFSSYKHQTRFFETIKRFFLLFLENKSCIHAQVTAVALHDRE